MKGPDGWAYATPNNGRLPNLPQNPTPLKHDTQIPFREIGQLWSYIQSGTAYECPDDLIQTQPNSPLFRNRPVQITSYSFNGLIAGYSSQYLPEGLTYKISRFLPTDVFAIESHEAFPFYFNDAGFGPEEAPSLVSSRHGGFTANSTTSPPQWVQEYGSNVGCTDGSAELMGPSARAAERENLRRLKRTRFQCFPWQ